MIIGVPKEIKNNENRVGMTPAGVAELVKRGHTVYVQASAGANSGFSDDDYIAVGAQMLPTIEDTYAIADMIVKVKEPIAPEYKLIKKGQVVFTYFHFAADKLLTEAMIASGAVCIAYETVEKEDRSLPLLTPMSEVAGRMATQVGARFLEKPQGGKGKLMGGVTGVRPARVLILGGGIVGTNAAQIAAGMGAEVLIADINLPRLRYLSEVMPKNVKTLYSSLHNIKMELPTIDLVIGSVLIPGDKAPHLITKEMLKMMKPGTVLVDRSHDSKRRRLHRLRNGRERRPLTSAAYPHERSGGTHGHPGRSTLPRKTPRRQRETDGWRDGCTPRTRTYPGRRHCGHQCRTNSCRNGCRGTDCRHQPSPPALPQ